ncbi:MAG: STAS domain-containing protein [Burkholderiaceae bacterium]
MSKPSAELIDLGNELMIYQVAKVKAEIERCLSAQSTATPALKLDCARLNEIDAAGLQLLMVTARYLQLNRGRLQLLRVSHAMQLQLQRWDALNEIDVDCVN